MVDCDDCALQGGVECDDCLVTFLVDGSDRGASIVDAGEAKAVRLLASAGLVPELRHLPRTG